MSRWLFKSEPETWSWDDQRARGEAGEPWNGVRNFAARNHMRAMRRGDLGFFYHSGKAREIVGIVEVVRESFPDPTADDPRWDCVAIRAVEPLPAPVPLARIRETPALAGMALIRQSRLSVQPVADAEWETILSMAKAITGS